MNALFREQTYNFDAVYGYYISSVFLTGTGKNVNALNTSSDHEAQTP
jgi:hypothetical protein